MLNITDSTEIKKNSAYWFSLILDYFMKVLLLYNKQGWKYAQYDFSLGKYKLKPQPETTTQLLERLKFKMQNTLKCWKGTFIHYWWKCKMV